MAQNKANLNAMRAMFRVKRMKASAMNLRKQAPSFVIPRNDNAEDMAVITTYYDMRLHPRKMSHAMEGFCLRRWESFA